MKRFLCVLGVVVLFGGMAGCQSGLFRGWRNDDSAAVCTPVVVQDVPVIESDSCSAGCSSCAGSAAPVISGQQTYAPTITTPASPMPAPASTDPSTATPAAPAPSPVPGAGP